MDQDPENLKKSVKEHGKKLAKLGTDLGEIQFSYKIEEKATQEYWTQRIVDFKKYNQKGLEYYEQVHVMMDLVNTEEAQRFLLRVSRFRQLGTALLKTMEKIKENPTIADSKDRQQSLWSKEIKNQITKQSNDCLQHEMDINTSFRDFYDKHLKSILK